MTYLYTIEQAKAKMIDLVKNKHEPTLLMLLKDGRQYALIAYKENDWEIQKVEQKEENLGKTYNFKSFDEAISSNLPLICLKDEWYNIIQFELQEW